MRAEPTPFLWVIRVLASLFLLGYLSFGFLAAFIPGGFPRGKSTGKQHIYFTGCWFSWLDFTFYGPTGKDWQVFCLSSGTRHSGPVIYILPVIILKICRHQGYLCLSLVSYHSFTGIKKRKQINKTIDYFCIRDLDQKVNPMDIPRPNKGTSSDRFIIRRLINRIEMPPFDLYLKAARKYGRCCQLPSYVCPL